MSFTYDINKINDNTIIYPSLPPSSTMGTTGAFILVAILLHPMYNNNGMLGGHHLVKMELILSGGKVDRWYIHYH